MHLHHVLFWIRQTAFYILLFYFVLFISRLKSQYKMTAKEKKNLNVVQSIKAAVLSAIIKRSNSLQAHNKQGGTGMSDVQWSAF